MKCRKKLLHLMLPVSHSWTNGANRQRGVAERCPHTSTMSCAPCSHRDPRVAAKGGMMLSPALSKRIPANPTGCPQFWILTSTPVISTQRCKHLVGNWSLMFCCCFFFCYGFKSSLESYSKDWEGTLSFFCVFLGGGFCFALGIFGTGGGEGYTYKLAPRS